MGDHPSDEHVVCNVCRDGGWTEQNMIVFCEGPCGITVHQKCYGVLEIPEGDIPWYCDVCAPDKPGGKPKVASDEHVRVRSFDSLQDNGILSLVLYLMPRSRGSDEGGSTGIEALDSCGLCNGCSRSVLSRCETAAWCRWNRQYGTFKTPPVGKTWISID